MLFLHLLYDENSKTTNSTEVAKKLDYSKMTMTRAFAELQNLGLVTAKPEGIKIIFSTTNTSKALFEKGKKYLRSPVMKKVYTDNIELLQSTPISGLQALSHKTMSNPPRYQIRAIHKFDKRLNDITLYDKDNLDNYNI